MRCSLSSGISHVALGFHCYLPPARRALRLCLALLVAAAAGMGNDRLAKCWHGAMPTIPRAGSQFGRLAGLVGGAAQKKNGDMFRSQLTLHAYIPQLYWDRRL